MSSKGLEHQLPEANNAFSGLLMRPNWHVPRDADDIEAFGIDIRNIRALRGPNLYAHLPVLQITLDVGPYEEYGSDSFPGFIERLIGWLPGLFRHECSVGRPGGFVERLRRRTYLGHICEHVTLELQMHMGFNVAYGRVRGTGERGVYNVVIEYDEEVPAREAFFTSLRLTLAAMHDLPFDAHAELETLASIADRYRLGPSTAAIVAAARARKIPVLRLTPMRSVVQLGHGVHQKRIVASETSTTSSIAVDMCQEKTITNRMLRVVAVPVPEGEAVFSPSEAWRVACDVGVPVVVKPADGNQGKGVSVNLTTEEEIKAAYEIAQEYGDQVLVEQYIVGNDYRLLVVNGKMVAAARRDPARVIGDGTHTVRELVERVNRDPARRPGHSGTLTRIVLDQAAALVLQQQDMTFDSVPGPEQVVRLRSNGNLSTGGTATDVTDVVHQRNAYYAELAAQILGLDVAGVDMICRDISRPLTEQNGAIVEVNAAPGLRMHLAPTQGHARDVATPIVEMLYPPGASARIPIIAVTGTNGKTTVTRLVSHILETGQFVVGMTSTEGVYVNKARMMSGDCAGPKSAWAVLLHPHVEVAVLETARGGILREGLAFNACSVAVVTNIASDHLGIDGINTLEDLAEVKQVVVETVDHNGTAVLNADDPLVSQMAAAVRGQIIYVSLNEENPVIVNHMEKGGKCVFVNDGSIIMAAGDNHYELMPLDRVRFAKGGQIPFQMENALLAVAAAWAERVSPPIIARALSTFQTDFRTVPGRFNVFDIDGVELLLDYGHNAAALKALGKAAQALGERRTTMVLALPGDRRNEDIIAALEATFPYVNQYVFYDHHDRRDRAKGEVPELMRKQLPEDRAVTIAEDEQAAILKAWQDVEDGQRLIIIADIPHETFKVLEALTGSILDHAACLAPVSSTT